MAVTTTHSEKGVTVKATPTMTWAGNGIILVLCTVGALMVMHPVGIAVILGPGFVMASVFLLFVNRIDTHIDIEKQTVFQLTANVLRRRANAYPLSEIRSVELQHKPGRSRGYYLVMHTTDDQTLPISAEWTHHPDPLERAARLMRKALGHEQMAT